MFEDDKWVIRSRNSENDREYNDQKKTEDKEKSGRQNKDLFNNTKNNFGKFHVGH